MAAADIFALLSWRGRVQWEVHDQSWHAIRKYICHFVVVIAKKYLQVNWPKLNTPQWAVEAYSETLDRARKDPIVGSFIGRAGSESGSLEEGKKRRE
jgi:hypothetical protein